MDCVKGIDPNVTTGVIHRGRSRKRRVSAERTGSIVSPSIHSCAACGGLSLQLLPLPRNILMLLLTVLLAVYFAPLAVESAEVDFIVRENIVYSTVADRELLLDAWVPNEEGCHPAVLVVHGGAWRFGNRKQLRGYANALAKRGFACFAIDYRLAPNDKFPAQIDDCREAVKWIRAHAAEYTVDPNKLGAIGYSAGSHGACRATMHCRHMESKRGCTRSKGPGTCWPP